MTFLTSLLAFAVAIGVLVTVHEYGHYLAARLVGVKVLRFSVGFGRPIFKRYFGRDRTEFVIAALPLGGYVKMLDEREGPVAEEEVTRAFNQKGLGARTFVVSAGPAANFLLAILVYAVMFMVGVGGIKPILGEVAPDTPAAEAGLERGQEILRVGDREVADWEQANLRLLDHAVRGEVVTLLLRGTDGREIEREVDLRDRQALLAEGQFLDKLGLQPYRPMLEPRIGTVEGGSPAAAAGLEVGDRVLAVDGEPVADWNRWVEVVRAHPEADLRVTVERDGRTLELRMTPEATDHEGVAIGRIGAGVDTDQPAARDMAVLVRQGPGSAFVSGAERTWDVTVLTLGILWRMITGDASVKNISGPVTIAEFAGVSALIGISAFLGFLGLVSVSLGIINLLPIPMLDGGHLLYYAAEAVKGSPVSERTQIIGQQVGLLAIAGLMVLALYNDLTRLFG
ncbi:RIP metalloprotease RseP [Thioalkalivibrio versutus]|uniref:RIP metalloprotease RseP n=1 Tax=Thioalkalivibrio versutus TaxID=106634 RepID=UPI0003754330|nr:RIP metalloprotease RseP [Thioalkalivibrio versutus]OOC50903.1 RIP metalloprotease RseP [Thioalkalivibrio versutus]